MVQAYRQAPWRIHTQQGALLLIVAILGASVLWVMVSVTVQAASAGLDVQDLEDTREELQRQIAGLKTQYAALTSAKQMEKRAEEMGFEPVAPENITYVVIPGYLGREADVLASPPGTNIQPPLIKPAYTQSLWEWLLQGIMDISEQPGGSSP
jgi:cell division protein FtsL